MNTIELSEEYKIKNPEKKCPRCWKQTLDID